MSRSAATEHARTYLAAFLPADRAEELARAAVEEAGPDADPPVALAAAHRRLTHEVRVTDEVAADVLVEEVGLTPHDAAAVLDLPAESVVAAVEEARAIAEELGVTTTPPEAAPGAAAEVRYVFDAEAPGTGTPGSAAARPRTAPEPPDDERPDPSPGRRVASLVVGLAVVVAVVLAVAMSARGSDGGAVAGRVTVTDVRTTDAMGQDGPGTARDVFAPAEAVIFWFAYEPLDGDAVVELALMRDGEQLISPTFPLSQGQTDSHVTLPRVVTEEPGSYRIELRRDGRPLVEAGFEVEAQ